MNHVLHIIHGELIAEIPKSHPVIQTAQDFLETMMNLPADTIVLHQQTLPDTFFDLRSGLAGEILQKVVNYGRRVAIVGDFTPYTSKSLQDFIRESNRGNTAVFTATISDAVEKLGIVKTTK
jgi:hypothetical protein